MKKALAVVAAMCLCAIALVASAVAATGAASGDTCTASGSGSTYTLHIATGSAQQYSFAFGAGGATIRNAVIPGTNGSFTTQKLAPNTTGAWVSDTPLAGGLAVTLSLQGTPSGLFTVVPSGASQSPRFAPVTCTRSSGTPPKTNASLSVGTHVTYDAAAGAWHIVVTIPTAGTVSAVQPEPTINGASAKAANAKPAIESSHVTLKSAGNVTLTLRPTGIGKTELKAKGAIKLQLRVTVDTSTGASGSKLLSLALRK